MSAARHVALTTAFFAVLSSVSGPVHAQDQKRSKAQPPNRSAPLYDRVSVLCVGITIYEDGKLNLDTPADNAQRLAALFRERYGYEAMEPLINSKATKGSIELAIGQWANALTEREAGVLCLSMHGASVRDEDKRLRGFLVPHDATLDLNSTDDYKSWRDQAIGMHWLGELVKRSKARHILVLVESCCSGYMGTMGDPPPLLRSEEILGGMPSRAAITAGTTKQLAKDGVFGSALLAILGSQNRAMTARELHMLLRDRVMAEVGQEMTPQFRELLTDGGEFVFVPKGLPRDQVAADIRSSNQSVLKSMGSGVDLQDVFAAFEAPDYRFSADPPTRAQNWRANLDRFASHAAAGNPLAMACLYYCYSKGLGTEKDSAVACRWAQEAYDSGSPVGKHVLGACFLHGIGIERNEIVAERLFQEAAEQGAVLSRYKLAVGLLDKSERTKQTLPDAERSRAVTWLRECGAAGLAVAHTRLAFALAIGLGGIPEDQHEAIRLLEKACAANEAEACFRLASTYGIGMTGVLEKDAEQCTRLMERAAAAGYSTAQVALGRMYLEAQFGKTRDPEKAIQWLRLAERQGDAKAKLALAMLYFEWQGVTPNWDEARRLLDSAVSDNSPEAIRYLADNLYLGRYGFLADTHEAKRLWMRAAKLSPEMAWKIAIWLAEREPTFASSFAEIAALGGVDVARDSLMFKRPIGPDYDVDESQFPGETAESWFRRAARHEYSELRLTGWPTFGCTAFAFAVEYCYDKAAKKGHPEAQRILRDRPTWWFNRARAYEARKMPLEATWAYMVADNLGHPEAATLIDARTKQIEADRASCQAAHWAYPNLNVFRARNKTPLDYRAAWKRASFELAQHPADADEAYELRVRQGAALYRMGRYADACVSLDHLKAFRENTRSSRDRLDHEGLAILAMAEAHLGSKDQAKARLSILHDAVARYWLNGWSHVTKHVNVQAKRNWTETKTEIVKSLGGAYHDDVHSEKCKEISSTILRNVRDAHEVIQVAMILDEAEQIIDQK